MIFKHILSVLAFMIVSFSVQGVSHFLINKKHYASIEHMRSDQIIPLGLLVMVIQGILLTTALSAWKGSHALVMDGLVVSMVFGLFLGSYIALVEPAKYAVPSVSQWISVEASASTIQFVAFGLLLGFIHQQLA